MEVGVTAKLVIIGPELSAVVETFTVFENCIPLFTKYSTQQEEIDTATLENYIAYQSNISEEEIVNLLEQDDLDKMKLDFNIDDATIEDALKSNSNLEQYLID